MPRRESESSPGPLEGEGTGEGLTCGVVGSVLTSCQQDGSCRSPWCGGDGPCRAGWVDVRAVGLLRVDIPLGIVSIRHTVATRVVPRASGGGGGDGCVECCGAMLSISRMVDSGSEEKYDWIGGPCGLSCPEVPPCFCDLLAQFLPISVKLCPH